MNKKPNKPFLSLPLALAFAAITASSVHAFEINSSSNVLQGGSNNSSAWEAPYSQAYKVYVRVPADSTATNALYRVYPSGMYYDACVADDSFQPCFEVPVDTSKSPGEWVQLKLNGDPATQWSFTKLYGLPNVYVNARNLVTSEVLTTASVLFENPRIGEAYQGGIIIALSANGQHGLIAANQDLPKEMTWFGAKKAVKDSANYDAEGKKYSDWRVPTINELNIVYQHQDLVNATGTQYWSSTSTSKSLAWLEIFRYPDAPSISGYRGFDGVKARPASVRPVRSF